MKLKKMKRIPLLKKVTHLVLAKLIRGLILIYHFLHQVIEKN